MFPQPQPGSALTVILEVSAQFLDKGFAPWSVCLIQRCSPGAWTQWGLREHR